MRARCAAGAPAIICGAILQAWGASRAPRRGASISGATGPETVRVSKHTHPRVEIFFWRGRASKLWRLRSGNRPCKVTQTLTPKTRVSLTRCRRMARCCRRGHPITYASGAACYANLRAGGHPCRLDCCRLWRVFRSTRAMPGALIGYGLTGLGARTASRAWSCCKVSLCRKCHQMCHQWPHKAKRPIRRVA